MKLQSSTFKIGAVVVGITGIAAGAFIGYYAYIKHHKQEEDKDEGIGDVESIVSDGEVENASLPSIPSMQKSPLSSTLEEKSNEKSIDETLTTPFANKPVKVLLLGLDTCGKTSMLNLLAQKLDSEPYKTTVGFNAIQEDLDGLALSIVEVGGGISTRSYWKNFTKDCTVIAYMVDGSNTSLVEMAKEEFKNLLSVATPKDVNCLLISNKQDIEGAMKANEVFDEKFVTDIALKGVSNVTLLNTSCIRKADGNSDRDIIMNVIVTLVKENC